MSTIKSRPASANRIRSPSPNYSLHPVYVFGVKYKPCSWKDSNETIRPHASGLIFRNSNKHYVLTTRDEFIFCQTLYVYYNIRKQEGLQEVKIVFQSAEFNLVVLELNNIPDVGVSLMDLKSSNPLKLSTNSTYRCMSSKYINEEFKTTFLEVKYEKLVITPETSSMVCPMDTIHYIFSIKKQEGITSSIIGSIIVSDIERIVGMVNTYNIKKDHLVVTPIKILNKVFTDFIKFQEKPNEYRGLQQLEFKYHIEDSKDDDDKIKQLVIDQHEPDEKNLIPKSRIKAIDKKPLLGPHSNTIVYINDDELDNIPLHLYIKLNASQDKPITVTIDDEDIQMYTKPCNYNYSSLSHFNPSTTIPYISYHNLIIIEVNKEYLDISKDELKDIGKLLIIEGPKDNSFKNNYLYKANNTNISSLKELQNIITNKPKINIEYGKTLKSKKYKLLE